VTPEHFRAIRDIFDAIVDLPKAEQRARLAALTNDGEVLRGVEELLDASASVGDTRIGAPVQELLSGLASPMPKSGDQFGAWRIASEIGHGGMGSVYLVNRADGHFEQTAALKFLKGIPSQTRLDYFARERQTLATLTHPNIARLLDGGATQNGQPYLVMEYVDGTHIDEYCRSQALSVRAILKLFVTACDAVAFAHRQLIIHCDLKPSNLLVNRDGRPVLLDFGIARLAENVGSQSPLEADAPAVSASVSAYSPRYASPEQRESGTVSIASDIYSLGVMLRELLQAPVSNSVPIGVATAVSNSTTSITSKGAFNNQDEIDDELNALLAVATAPERAKRYPTVDAFTDDINRYLSNFPLHALPASSAYTAKKFVRRQWPVVLASAVFAATVIGFTIKVAIESQRARQAESEAIAQRDIAAKERDNSAKERDSAAKERDRAVIAERQAVTERDATKQAEAEALRERDRASAAERAVVIQRNVAVTERDRAQLAQKNAVIERNKAVDAELASKQVSDFMVGVFRSSNPNASGGDIPASVLLTEAEARLEKELNDRPQVQAALFNTLGFVRKNMGSPAQSLVLFGRAIAIERAQLQPQRPLILADMLFQLSDAYTNTATPAKALPSAKEALALREKNAAPDSAIVGRSLGQVGHLLAVTGERAEGGKLLQRAVAILEKADDQQSLSSTLANISVYHFQMGEMEEAESTTRRALEIRRKLDGEAHPSTNKMREDLGFVLNRRGKFIESEPILRQSVDIWVKIFGRDNANVVRASIRLVDSIAGQGRFQEARTLALDNLATIEKIDGKQTSRYNLTLYGVGMAHMRVADYPAAEAAFAAAMQHIRKNLNPKEEIYARTLAQLGLAQTRNGKLDQALANLTEAFDVFKANRGESTSEAGDYLMHLADWAITAGKWDEADARLTRIAAFLPFKEPARAIRYEKLRAQFAARNK